ncbi:MAG: CopD family protein [Caulobacterales bacterium]
MLYDLLRGLHLIAVIAWIAGMLMLPRYFVHHFSAPPGSEWDERLKSSEARLLRIIINPAMTLALIFGGILIWQGLQQGRYPWPFDLWLWAKLVLVTALFGLHGIFSAARRKFAQGERPKTERYWRMMNEAPFILAILIVLLATVEPR